MIIANIIVLIFEVLYYSMFMYYAKSEGKFNRYILLFSLITIIILFVGNDSILSYFLFMILSFYGLKYIVKVNAYLYDMFVTFAMFFVSFLIPIPIYLIGNLFTNNIFIITLSYCFTKVFIIFLTNKIINKIFKKLKVLWYKNIFIIRYIFIICAIMLVIFSCIYQIKK